MKKFTWSILGLMLLFYLGFLVLFNFLWFISSKIDGNEKNTEKKESPEKIIGEDLISNSFRNQKTYQQQMRLADMESQLKNLKGQLTKTKEQLEKTEVLLREELSSGKQLQKMKDDYSNWVADPRDVRFDESWKLILMIAFLLPTTLSCLFFWIILT